MRIVESFMALLAASVLVLAVPWSPPATNAEPADLVAILAAHYLAVNRGDVNAAVAVFTDDAVMIRGGTCRAASPCTAKALIQRQMESEIGGKSSFGILNSQVSGNTVTAKIEFWNRSVPPLGIQRIIWNATVTFTGDKISRLVHELDFTDAQTQVFGNFDRVAGLGGARGTAQVRGDLAAVIAFYADNAVYEGLGLCAASPCVGKAAIQTEMARQIADHLVPTSVGGSVRVVGDILTSRQEVRSDSIRAAGVDRIIVLATLEVKGGKITSHRQIPDATDPQTATYLQVQAAAAGAQAPAALPATGESDISSKAAAMLGVVLVLLGLGLRYPPRKV